MDNLSRSELSIILESLHYVRDERREELLDVWGSINLMDDVEYRKISDLQAKILASRDKMAY